MTGRLTFRAALLQRASEGAVAAGIVVGSVLYQLMNPAPLGHSVARTVFGVVFTLATVAAVDVLVDRRKEAGR